jgi:hypothetical protein
MERTFSNFGWIHSKIRNRLGNDTSAKLVFCYRMLRGHTSNEDCCDFDNDIDINDIEKLYKQLDTESEIDGNDDI